MQLILYWKLEKNQGFSFCLIKLFGDIAGSAIGRAPIDGLLNSCFERLLEIFLAGYYTQVFFSVCHVLVPVLMLVGENRAWAFSHFAFLKTQARCYNSFNFNVSGNRGSKRELSISYSENNCSALPSFSFLVAFPSTVFGQNPK